MTSKKSVSCKLASMVICNPLLLKMLTILFFIRSIRGPKVFSQQANPSSLYKPIEAEPNSFLSKLSG